MVNILASIGAFVSGTVAYEFIALSFVALAISLVSLGKHSSAMS